MNIKIHAVLVLLLSTLINFHSVDVQASEDNDYSELGDDNLTIIYRQESAYVNGPMVIKIKGSKIRIDSAPTVGDQVTSIVDLSNKKVYVVSNSGKYYLEYSLEEAKELSDREMRNAGLLTATTAIDTGVSERFGEWEANIFRLGSFKLWLTRDSKFDSIRTVINRLKELTGQGVAFSGIDSSFFVLKSEIWTPVGSVRTVFKDVIYDNVSDEDFKISAKYRKIK